MANWNEIRAEYIRGGITQEQLADKHGVSVGSVRRRSAEEGWGALRQDRERGRTTSAEISARADRQLEMVDRALDIIAEAFDTDASELRSDVTRLGELVRHMCTLFSMQQALMEVKGDKRA